MDIGNYNTGSLAFQAEQMARRADAGAIQCDACGELIQVGEVKYTLGIGRTYLTICKSCKGRMVGSAEIHGCEDELYWE